MADSYNPATIRFLSVCSIPCIANLWCAVYCGTNCQLHQNAVSHTASQPSTGRRHCLTTTVSGVAARKESGSLYVDGRHRAFGFADASSQCEEYSNTVPPSLFLSVALVFHDGVFDVFYQSTNLLWTKYKPAKCGKIYDEHLISP